jgi:hypothetical protein
VDEVPADVAGVEAAGIAGGVGDAPAPAAAAAAAAATVDTPDRRGEQRARTRFIANSRRLAFWSVV